VLNEEKLKSSDDHPNNYVATKIFLTSQTATINFMLIIQVPKSDKKLQIFLEL
jgi:hypothetical protein